MQFSPQGAQLTRAELTRLLDQYERAVQSPVYSDRIKEEIRGSASLVRRRLEEGDFQAGDRIALTVRGQPEIPEVVTVEPGPSVTLPVFGEISLQGVLRSEIEEHLESQLGTMLRDPDVTAQSLLRLSIEGAVGSPGFFVLPADALLSDAIMAAGGPAGADYEKLRIERSDDVVYRGQTLQAALAAGRTLDQLSLQAGDRFVVPGESRSSFWPILTRYAIIIGSTVFLGVRIVG
jgi:protein involved in polysaccharide export with SLBB domain